MRGIQALNCTPMRPKKPPNRLQRNSVEKNAAMRALGVTLIEHGDDFQEARDTPSSSRPSAAPTWCPASTPTCCAA